MLYIVGFGPGSYEQMTVEADRALQESDLIIGYTTYVDIIRPWFPGKEFLVTPMKQEKERCRIAIEEEKKGKILPPPRNPIRRNPLFPNVKLAVTAISRETNTG